MALEATVIEQVYNFTKEHRILAIEFVFLCVAAILFTFFSVLFDISVDQWKLPLSDHPFSALLCVLCASVFVELFDPNMRGSGIPEMKVALSKNMNSRTESMLNVRAFLVKAFGLLLVLCSGLPFGREGPFVHMASMFFYLLFNFLIKLFVCTLGRITCNVKRPEFSPSMLSSACALGVACTFASPIGGVLFSIEVTSKHFKVRNYWKCCMVAVLGSIVFKLCGKETDLSKITNEAPVKLISMKKTYITAILIGLLGAAMALIFTMLFKIFHSLLQFLPVVIDAIILRLHKLCPWLLNTREPEPSGSRSPLLRIFHRDASAFGLAHSLIRCLLLTSINLFIYYTVTNESTDNLATYMNSSSFDNSSLFLFATGLPLREQLFALLFIKTVVAILLILLPVPCGIFKPLMFLGAVFGRFYAATAEDPVMPASLMGVLGAASVVGAVTQSVSAAIIVVDLTNQEQWLILALLSAFVANLIYKLFRPWNVLSIYDTMAVFRNMSYLPDEMDNKFQSFSAVHVESLSEAAVDLEVEVSREGPVKGRSEFPLEMALERLQRALRSGHEFFRLVTSAGECRGLLYRTDIPLCFMQDQDKPGRSLSLFCCRPASPSDEEEALESGRSNHVVLVPYGAPVEPQRRPSTRPGAARQAPIARRLVYTPLCHVTCWVPPYWNLLEVHQLMHERKYMQVLVSGQAEASSVITYERVLQKIDDLHKVLHLPTRERDSTPNASDPPSPSHQYEDDS